MWWYLDALSDDGSRGITLIAFVGSVFSPYYAWQRRRGRAVPEQHCAVNVALYGKGGKRWAMTERGQSRLMRDAQHLNIGPSSLRWDGHSLHIDVNEITAPIPSRLRGSISLTPRALTADSYDLDALGRHQWRPIAPAADVEVDLSSPNLSWRGRGYFDSNIGSEPVEQGFTYWDWSRAIMPNDDTVILYESLRRDDSRGLLALRYDAQGRCTPIEAPASHALPAGRIWRAPRGTRGDSGSVEIVETLEDTPFYTRSLLKQKIHGEPALAIHESLSLTRFAHPIVQLMLPFRMPRF